jgi:glycosyltransferase involved in cell wall biosynthesis
MNRMAASRDVALATTASVGLGKLKIAIGLASLGRPDIARETVLRLNRQTRPPDEIIVCVPTLDDFRLDEPTSGATMLVGPRGLTRQRNAILDRAIVADLICYIDDDFVLDDGYLAEVERTFLADPTLVCATGMVLQDGIIGPGLSFSDADEILANSGPVPLTSEPAYNAYGCNMIVKMETVRKYGLRFDETLPRYGWLEDVDFSRLLASHGSVRRLHGARGVHLGVKSGRQAGRCFGYSQVANPLHLVRKGTYTWNRAAWLMSRNIAMNFILSMHPEPFVDRRGRVSGNMAAAVDLLRGRLHPQRIDML